MGATDAETQTAADLFPDSLTAGEVEKELAFTKPIKTPVWSHQKARLIELYLYYFVQVTKHGAYIDGFAGPQSPDHDETWSAKRVLERRPRRLQKFFLCELDPTKVASLEALCESQPPKEAKEPKRTCVVLPGDFNQLVDGILENGRIRQKEATFALLDQRTFECHWATVRKLAGYKQTGLNKIELFYFFAVKWLHRAMHERIVNEDRIDAWWGSSDWTKLRSTKQWNATEIMTQRFREELGYRWAMPYPIFQKEDGEGAVMYYMIHATDHPVAPGLMHRAYRFAVTPEGPPPEQGKLFAPA